MQSVKVLQVVFVAELQAAFVKNQIIIGTQLTLISKPPITLLIKRLTIKLLKKFYHQQSNYMIRQLVIERVASILNPIGFHNDALEVSTTWDSLHY